MHATHAAGRNKDKAVGMSLQKKAGEPAMRMMVSSGAAAEKLQAGKGEGGGDGVSVPSP